MFATASRIPSLLQQQSTTTSSNATSTSTSTSTGTSNNNSNNNATAYIAIFHDGNNSTTSTATATNDDDDNNKNYTLIQYALEKMYYDCIVNGGQQWSMIVTILSDLEALAEEQEEQHQHQQQPKQQQQKQQQLKRNCSQLAAAIASKVFFYLEEPISALRLALLSGPYCPAQLLPSSSVSSTLSLSSSTSALSNNDPYVTTLIRAALDTYIQAKQKEWEAQKDMTFMSSSSSASATKAAAAATAAATSLLSVQQLQPLIDQVILSSCQEGIGTNSAQKYTYAIGLCYDAYDVSKIQWILQQYIIPQYKSTTTTNNNNNNSVQLLQTIVQYIIHCTTHIAPGSTSSSNINSDSNNGTNTDRTFSHMVLSMLVTELQSIMSMSITTTLTTMNNMDHQMILTYDIVRMYQYLNEPLSIAKMIHTLLQQSFTKPMTTDTGDTNTTTTTTTTKLHLTILQIVFNIVDDMCGNQSFCQTIANQLVQYRTASAVVDNTTTTTTTATTTTTSTETNGGTVVDVAAATSSTTVVPPPVAVIPSTSNNDDDDTMMMIWDNILRVLTGGFVSELTLSFRHKHNGADHKVMELVKKVLEDRSSGSNRNSVLHTTAIVTHSYLYAGTTYDAFLRNHLDWLKKASHWAKFTATASLGVIHADHITEAMQLLEQYLPFDPDDGTTTVSTTGGYAEGGALYALGLIHGSSGTTNTEKRTDAATFLRKHLRASHANEAISHGASLAVGLTCFGSADIGVVHELKDVLVTDFAVAGEAAGMAIGMVLVGSGAGNIQNALPDNTRDELMDVVSELKNYARETQHEKIIRGIAMGLAIMNFGQEENADATIEEMRTDRDPVMRYGAQYAIALAYCGTGSNKAIRILLHTAVSDVSDDVRMAAVIGLAFVLFKTPDRVPQLVKLLLESFNPHVRYASCMAVGIAMAGSGDSDSIALLEPMLDDMTDYVRQGALIGTAMIYMQQSDTCNGRKIRTFREKLTTLISEKHQSTLTKMGAILSIGIVDAGGRNCALQLGSRNGFTKMTSAVGLALWLQHWHWFPMMHMFSLALTPTLTIGLNKNLKYPKSFEIICNAKPSQFAFPKKLQEKKEKVKKHVETFTLSTTAKEKARLARKKAKEEKDTMDEGDEPKLAAADAEEKSGDAMDVDKEGGEGEGEVDEEEKPKKKRDPEPVQFTISNPARVTKAQSQYCIFDTTQRYRPIRLDESPYGVIMLLDCTPEEEEYIGTVKSPSLEPLGELAPPEPFDWIAPPLPVSTDDDNGDDKDMKETTE